MSICVWVCASTPLRPDEGVWQYCIWSYKWLGVTRHGFWKPNLGSSARAVHTLKNWDIFPAPLVYILKRAANGESNIIFSVLSKLQVYTTKLKEREKSHWKFSTWRCKNILLVYQKPENYSGQESTVFSLFFCISPFTYELVYLEWNPGVIYARRPHPCWASSWSFCPCPFDA